MRRLWPVLILVGVLAAAAGLWSRRALQPTEAPLAQAPTEPQPALEERDVLLYFAAADGLTLGSVSAQVSGCNEDVDCMRGLLALLAAGPPAGRDDLAPVLPAGTRVLEVGLDEDVALVDFSRELVAAHPGGSRSELLTAYAVADTLAVNFPWLRQVRIKVEGVPVDTLKGHVDLRLPVTPDFRLVRRAARLFEDAQGDGTGEADLR
ncbi:MAG: hypothetical protein Kow00100_20210 [Geothermobacteraceae bacterium]